ncbi:non-heme iron oxygenase ferredoxin subunit [SAR202 cluster bacterium AD-804-J14_MRT_500m]|nr:non-heme iron oxygenase ferredoxin subunit [SAR202 cluster bacterium AD-804-J14_MRT_500m]
MAEEFTKVAETQDLPPGSMKAVNVGAERVLLVNVDGSYFAVGDECTHAAGNLSDGDLDGDQVECPIHGAMFNVKTGEAVTPPADEALPCYRVKVDGSDIFVSNK